MTSDPHDSHREDQDQPAEPEPGDEPQPKDEPAHGHARPGTADMRAALAVARAILTGDDPAAHDAAASGTCLACTTVAAVSFGFSLTATLAGEQIGLSRQLATTMLAAVQATEAELRAAGN